MANAMKELQSQIRGLNIQAATLHYEGKEYSLKVGHTLHELWLFLNSIDFEYDDGYGTQELDGTVWFEDGSWLERGEYDGSEWWDRKVRPEIPDRLK